MKKLLILGMALLAVTLASAQENKGINFQNVKLSELLQKAKSEKKLAFVDIYATWCGPCKAMEANVYPRQEVGDYMNQHFVCAKYDGEQSEGLAIVRRYHVEAYPTYLLLDAEGNLMGKMVGGSPADIFLKKVEGQRQKASHKQLHKQSYKRVY